MRLLASLATLLLVGCHRTPPPARTSSVARPRDYEALARALYAGEPEYERRWPVEFKLRVVEGLLQDLQRAARELGTQMGAPYFAAQVEFSWPVDEGKRVPSIDAVETVAWSPHASAPTPVAAVQQHFAAWMSAFRLLDRAVWKAKDAHELAGGDLEARVSIELAGVERDGHLRRDSATAEARFAKVEGSWRITRFAVQSGETQRATARMFDDVTEAWTAALPPAVHSMLLARSRSDEMHRMLLDDKNPPSNALNHLLPLAMDAHPGVVVVDIDRDGFDDLFVWDVEGPAVLLHNEAGHGFRDATDEMGLDVSEVSSAAFADLDGDGKLDAVIGHWFIASEIRFGAGGRFWPGSAGRFHLPSHVASISLADMDSDGKLDIYFATAAQDFHPHLQALLDGNTAAVAHLNEGERALLEEALPAARAAKIAGRFDINVDQFGPRDFALLNRGDGVFEDATERLGLLQYRNTLQAAFADLDGDGHADLYLANDFAPANMYRYKDGHYVDISASSGADRIYFGMGASFGDFDNDGDLDLYASAMESSAGARIMANGTNFSPEHSAQARRARLDAARGNTLLRNDGDGNFVDITATPQFALARHGNWAYSAQMVDVDGDGWLDLFSPNGFFTSTLSPDDPFVRDL